MQRAHRDERRTWPRAVGVVGAALRLGLLAVVAVLSPPASLAAEKGVAARYVVLAPGAGGMPEPVFERVVRLAEPPAARPVDPADSWRGRFTLIARDRGGATVLTDRVAPAPRPVEVPAMPGEEWRAAAVAAEEEPFVVRLPATAASLELIEIGGPRRALHALAEEQAAGLGTLAQDAGTANRLDLLVMGDGYTAAESARFAADAADFAARLLASEPYAAYRGHFTVTQLFTASAQSGADHPPYRSNCPAGDPSCCSDPASSSDPLGGQFRTTAFDATFCSHGIQRLLTVNRTKVQQAAAAVPGWDAIVLLVNDPTYGGSGGAFAVASTHRLALEIVRHELAHAFTRLADEYDTPYPGYPSCSDRAAFLRCEANVTDIAERAALKWGPWIEATTPVPTPPSSAWRELVGLFEGARYLLAGMFRPMQDCAMRTSGVPFCRVCAQEFVLRLYRGGWGSPAAGIDPIEPGSERPAPGDLRVVAGETLELSVVLLQPASGPLAVTWVVDGAEVEGASSASLAFVPAAGVHTIELRVRDATPLVHPSLAGDDLTSIRTWTVTATGRRPRQVLPRLQRTAPSGKATSAAANGTGRIDPAGQLPLRPRSAPGREPSGSR